MVATAAYDGIIRVWTYNSENSQEMPKCTQSITGHKGYVNSLIFEEDGSKMYSADATGYIKVWDTGLDENQRATFKCITTVDIFFVRFQPLLIIKRAYLLIVFL